MARRITRKTPHEGLEKRPAAKKQLVGRELLDAIDESPDFHDPYSELNLYLSQKVKREMRHCSNSKKWSPQLQADLLHKITPEFQERFPKYRLGISALKKTWEKVQFFSAQIQEQKEALTQDGKLNIPFFIKENLKTATRLQNTCHLHPCHYAQQLAVKMSECIAVVDGIRPKLDQLTRTIWSLQRHLIPKLSPEHFKSPYDENEKVDKLIVKAILEITAKQPEISQAELSFHVQKRLIQLQHITATYSPNQMKKMLSALYADQCHYLNQRMERTLERIPYPTAKCLKEQLAAIALDNPYLGPEQVTEDAFAAFEKATIALADLEEVEIERKIQNWTIQSDMLLRWIRLNETSALYKEIETIWKEKKDLSETAQEVQKQFLVKYPRTIGFAKELETHMWIYLKYFWYTKTFEEKTATYDRLIKWHKELLKSQNLSPHEIIEKIEKLCKKRIPLMPFNRARTQTILFTEEEEYSY
ncbi:MAG: hypothetical protein KR126chlam3_01332 [Chlamydiae bacterium]|nr:hypothetical protein [Chlamydiota bacterium]